MRRLRRGGRRWLRRWARARSGCAILSEFGVDHTDRGPAAVLCDQSLTELSDCIQAAGCRTSGTEQPCTRTEDELGTHAPSFPRGQLSQRKGILNREIAPTDRKPTTFAFRKLSAIDVR